MRTWPASTSIAALVRALTPRACHSHLSSRWRSKHHQIQSALILAIGGELFLERRQFGKRRIGIGRTVPLPRGRRRAGGVLPERGAAITSVAAAFRAEFAFVPSLLAIL